MALFLSLYFSVSKWKMVRVVTRLVQLSRVSHWFSNATQTMAVRVEFTATVLTLFGVDWPSWFYQ